MKFNISIYIGLMERVGPYNRPETFVQEVAAKLEPELPKFAARKPTEQQKQHYGFAPLRLEDGSPTMVIDSGVLSLCVQKEAKVIPADTVAQKIDVASKAALAVINADLVEGEEPLTELPSDDRRVIKDAVMAEMMKTDHTVRTRCFLQLVSLGIEQGVFLVIVHTVSNTMREAALNLLRTALETLPVTPLGKLADSHFPYDAWLRNYIINQVSVVHKEPVICIGSNAKLKADDSVLKLTDLLNTNLELLKDVALNMSVTDIELVGADNWSCSVNRAIEIKELEIHKENSLAEEQDDYSMLMVLRGDLLMAGHWVIDFVCQLPKLFGAEEFISHWLNHAQNLAKQSMVSEEEENVQKLLQWQIANGNAEKPADHIDPIENNPFEETDYQAAVNVVRNAGRVSISMVQRALRLGYNKSARLVERMEREGVVSAPSHNGTRTLL